MKTKTIMKIVCANVPRSTSPKELYRIFLEVIDSFPDDKEEVLQALEESMDDKEGTDVFMDEDQEEGERQDPDFRSLIDDESESN